jgi:hypothetical protein
LCLPSGAGQDATCAGQHIAAPHLLLVVDVCTGGEKGHAQMRHTKWGVSRFIVLGFCLAAAYVASGAVISAGPFTNPGNGHQYFLLSQDSWTNSERAAVGMGGHLATINDTTEQKWVYDTFEFLGGQHRNLWIGLYNATKDLLGGQHAANFIWADGTQTKFANWASGEPNNIGNLGEWYVNMWRGDVNTSENNRIGGTWNDAIDNPYYADAVKCDPGVAVVNGVVELVPEPAMALMLPLAGGLLVSRVRRP